MDYTKNKKEQLQNILISLCELHAEILHKTVIDVQENLQDCQQATIITGETIEQEAPSEKEPVSILEKYCEELFYSRIGKYLHNTSLRLLMLRRIDRKIK